MGKSATRGQTLVELALVLPCFCLGVFTAVQLITYCHNMVELQRMAQVMCERQSPNRNHDFLNYTRFNSLWGNLTIHGIHRATKVADPWRKCEGFSTVRDHGWVYRLDVSVDLLPGMGFSCVLPRVTQKAIAESYFEAPAPPES